MSGATDTKDIIGKHGLTDEAGDAGEAGETGFSGTADRPLRVLFISYYIDDPSVPGFAPKYALLSERWKGDVLHLAPADAECGAGNFVFRGCAYHRGSVLLRQWRYLLFCLRHARRHGAYDLVISYDPMICGLISLLVKRMVGAKLLVEVNTDHFYRPEADRESMKARAMRWIKTGMMRLSFAGADAVKFINTRLAEDYGHRFGRLGPDRAGGPVRDTFFSFIGTQAFGPDTAAGSRTILTVGHPYWVKGVDVLIRAFNRIAPLYPDVRLKIIGMCPDLAAYKAMVDDASRIDFLPGISHREIVPHFQQCLFYVLASRTESMGRVMIEAMACGKAVVGARVGGVPDVIAEGETGLLFRSEDDADLARKMTMLLDDPALCRRMGEAGLHRCSTEFTPERYTERYFRFADRIMARGGEGA